MPALCSIHMLEHAGSMHVHATAHEHACMPCANSQMPHLRLPCCRRRAGSGTCAASRRLRLLHRMNLRSEPCSPRWTSWSSPSHAFNSGLGDAHGGHAIRQRTIEAMIWHDSYARTLRHLQLACTYEELISVPAAQARLNCANVQNVVIKLRMPCAGRRTPSNCNCQPLSRCRYYAGRSNTDACLAQHIKFLSSLLTCKLYLAVPNHYNLWRQSSHRTVIKPK